MKAMTLLILFICLSLLGTPVCYSKTSDAGANSEISCNQIEKSENQLRSVYCCQNSDSSCQKTFSCGVCVSSCCFNLVSFFSTQNSFQATYLFSSIGFSNLPYYQDGHSTRLKKPPRIISA